MQTIATDKHTVIVGLGKTGLSCARHLQRLGRSFSAMDTRECPPGIDEFEKEFPEFRVYRGGLDVQALGNASEIVISPGIASSTEQIQHAVKSGVTLRGDIDLFVDSADAPIVAITGSNGKSTVTTLVGEMAKEHGLKVGVGGNIGTPALDLLGQGNELYVLELSSFQLETTHQLGAECATLLNLSEDHMDRYDSKMAYLQAKQRIFIGARHVVVNDDEPLGQPLVTTEMKLIHFGLNGADLNKFSLSDEQGELCLMRGFDRLMPASEMAMKGRHNTSNALAALAIGSVIGLRMDAMLTVLKRFKGLDHRCQFLRCVRGVDYINDSKGTNVGASATAIRSIGADCQGRIVLIAGGDAKGANMEGLREPVKSYVRAAVLMGQDADAISQVLNGVVSICHVDSMHEAVDKAAELAQEGDTVLLSPACASMDMFENYEERGQQFAQEVGRL